MTEAPALQGLDVKWDAAIAPFTSLKVGGTVTALVTVRDEGELVRALGEARAAALPWIVLGAGSNLLAPDGATRALAIRLAGSFRDIAVSGTTVRAGAAVKCAQLARRLAQDELAGFEFAAGIPGCIGGCVVMNAGYGARAMADVLAGARLLDPPDRIADVPAAALELRYRGSRLRDSGEIVLAATLQLERGTRAAILEEIRAGDARRAATQPLSAPSCGSVFKNPPGDHAGRLIDAAGLKGLRIGGAEVSTVHANFIVTSPGARARDVLELIDTVRARVAQSSGVVLECEVIRLEQALRGGAP